MTILGILLHYNLHYNFSVYIKDVMVNMCDMNESNNKIYDEAT
jgi:hypothetical protein